MEQKKIDTALENDKSMVELLFTKEALTNYDRSTSHVPASYFDTFPIKLQNRIAKNKPSIFFLMPLGKMAIAAVFIFVIGSTFIFLNRSVDNNVAISSISMQNISNAEIEAYVVANEWMADIDWQSEAYNPESDLTQLNNDSLE